MKRKFTLLIILISNLVFLSSCNMLGKERDILVLMQTNFGDIKIRLYNETPLHRDNFVNLVKTGFYDSIAFHRIIDDFMIQGGDPSTKMEMNEETSAKYLYTIPAEIHDSLYHKKGVLAAARQGDQTNPERASSGTQFYIVEGRVFNDEELDNVEARINASLKQAVFFKHLMAERKRLEESGETKTAAEIQEFATLVAMDEIEEMTPYAIPPERRGVYKTAGGTPHLDRQYTVFGEVIEGLEFVESIAEVETDSRDKPLEDVLIIKAKIVRK